jgi:CheY-like chemotaxis protein
MHSGSIEARSDGPGMGCEFIVRIPLATAAQLSKSKVVHSEASAAASSLGILVVDDNADATLAMCMLLRSLGHDVRSAADGLEALAVAETFRPDVILLDIGLPGLNGYGVARHIRQQAWGKEMSIVAVTGWGQLDDRRKSMDAGFNLHMVKPVDMSELMNVLASVRHAVDELRD